MDREDPTPSTFVQGLEATEFAVDEATPQDTAFQGAEVAGETRPHRRTWFFHGHARRGSSSNPRETRTPGKRPHCG